MNGMAGGSGLVARHSDSKEHNANIPYGYGFVIAWLIILVLISAKNFFNPRIKKRLGYNIHPPGWVYLIPWVFILLIFGFYRTPHTLNGVCRRLGRITYATLPLSIVLSLRPSPLPGTYYIHLLEFHKWVSRTAVLMGSAHGIGYIVYLIKEGKAAKLAKPANLYGVVILISFLVMLVSSLRPLRSRFYPYFYRIHYPLAWLTVILGIFHARPSVPFLAGWCMFALVANIIYRLVSSTTVINLDVQHLSPSLLYITLPRNILPEGFPIGSHVRVSKSLWKPLTWISSSHPYTVASLSTDGHIKLLVRKTRFELNRNTTYSIQGPFSSPLESELVKAKKILIFAGGSGLSTAASAVRFFELRKSALIKLIWITRDKSDLKALDVLNIDVSIVDIYITGSGTTYTDGSAQPQTANAEYAAVAGTGEDDAIEFDDLEHLNRERQSTDDSNALAGVDVSDRDELSDEEDDLRIPLDSSSDMDNTPESTNFNSSYKQPEGLGITYGRPDFNKSSADFLDHTDVGTMTSYVMSCGPRELVQDVGKWAHLRGYQFFGERYAL